MAKKLRVLTPFFICEEGDMFKFDPEKKVYLFEKNEEFYKVANDTTSEVKSSFNSVFSISEDYAGQLIEDGVLEEVNEKKVQRDFVNVFDEIDGLIVKYAGELEELDTKNDNAPECVRLEKRTVLTNLLKVLNYLKNLKKA
jgi:hypothetical protein